MPEGTGQRFARITFGLTSLMVTGGLVLQMVLATPSDEGRFVGRPSIVVNVLSYFTVQSNILVAISTGLLALRLNRPSIVSV
jgi:hypothetical protein